MRRSLVLLLLVPGACQATPADDGRIEVVASLYPLAYLAERVGGPDVSVIDLTPPGTEAHDVELSLEDRGAIQTADIVVHIGVAGFQPQVEGALPDARGLVVNAGYGFGQDDPHIWLDPWAFQEMAEPVTDAFIDVDPEGEAGYRARFAALFDDLRALDESLRAVLGGDGCRYDTAIVTHEAFGEMFGGHVEQFGLSGQDPEGEPVADRLRAATTLVQDRRAGAIFFEETEEGRRVAEPLASDLEIPALPLSTLESQPATGDYVSVMHDNIASLREGLGCG